VGRARRPGRRRGTHRPSRPGRPTDPADPHRGTPSGGEHLYFLAPTATGHRCCATPRENRARAGLEDRHPRTRRLRRRRRQHHPDRTYRVIATGTRHRCPRGWSTASGRRSAPPPVGVDPHRGRTDLALPARRLTAETARVHDAPQRAAQRLPLRRRRRARAARGRRGTRRAPRPRVLLDAAGRHLAIGAYSPRQAEQTITSGLRAGAAPRRIADDKIGDAA
jgi:hypothetical protein